MRESQSFAEDDVFYEADQQRTRRKGIQDATRIKELC